MEQEASKIEINKQVKFSTKEINSIFEYLTKTHNSKIELDFNSDYTLLVAVILSARATDKGVNKATKILFEYVKTPQDMLEFGLERLKDSVKTIGLYNAKAERIMETTKILIQKHNSKIPSNLNELEALPGVGRKTANVILNELFEKPVFPVDTHVFRVANRIGLTHANNPIQSEQQLKAIVPNRYAVKAAHAMVLHGRYICKARKPDCDKCGLKNICAFYNTIKAHAPIKGSIK